MKQLKNYYSNSWFDLIASKLSQNIVEQKIKKKNMGEVFFTRSLF